MRLHLDYGMPACSPNLDADINHLELIQRLATRLGLHSLQRLRLRADPITAFKIFTCLLDIDLNLFFLRPARRGLIRHPYKVLQGASNHRRRRSASSVRVVKYWNKLSASVDRAPSVNVCKKSAGESLDRSLSPSPPLPEHSSPHLPTPLSHLHTKVIIFICHPNPCFVYVVSSGPLSYPIPKNLIFNAFTLEQLARDSKNLKSVRAV